ncbi:MULTISPECIES: dTDP-4-dehydrorhamnose reductase [unclassified Pseudomonas]|jgi:dTDP-4-dehydrorhamnose reductase|uniref:dTDP-4-dehydrorhamnose reductase n=1 Tax=unclassified Pseudomonas TaxID=196821 RepID=UPI000CD2425F|nr:MULTISPECIES: dTDP-4-dehydrorhamnose reductase [unclassified Pseudomonas]POA24509.1 dTDP-4-dehydrorhamnose reductase [Pseudomonas sp. FW305-3-2-15-E-TSA4]POA42618.1 dTDP-4-dehydrorhamnose reductase [Pseudomonas sp. FW305-3-2-15-E-TSA2]
MRKIVLLGSNGQVGWELQRSLPLLGTLVACDRSKVDLSDLEAVSVYLEQERPDVIVNAAAYNAVDLAESCEQEAQKINYHLVKVLADYAAANGVWLVHYSTDYVFDGESASPYIEADLPNPLSAYGRSKALGEKAVIASGCNYLLFRTSWVYSARGGNFAKTILRLAASKSSFSVVDDQAGAPTCASLVADTTVLCLYRILSGDSSERLSGTYHLVASGYASWYEYARYLISEALKLGVQLKCTEEDIRPVGSSEYPTKAIRPKNSRLDNSKIKTAFNINIPDWKIHIKRTLSDIARQG